MALIDVNGLPIGYDIIGSGDKTAIITPGGRFTRDSIGAPPELFVSRNWKQAVPLTDVATTRMGKLAATRAQPRAAPAGLRGRRREGDGPLRDQCGRAGDGR